MDLIKIGKYIAGKRKELGMTQKQLAEKLGMSDKSVSKWERGVCLPDVSVYSDLCLILGISINEFLAGEDIAQENIGKKSEENIVGVVTDSKNKQRRLETIISVLLFITILAGFVIGMNVYISNRPRNYITPVAEEGIEMETARLLAGSDGAFIYKFTTTDGYKSLKLYVSEYKAGELINKEPVELGFNGNGSPQEGEILIVPDFENFEIKIVISAGEKVATEIPILVNIPDRKYYARSATGIKESTNIRYNEEQALISLIYDNDEMKVPDINDLMNGEVDSLSQNDFVYFFSFEFCKK